MSWCCCGNALKQAIQSPLVDPSKQTEEYGSGEPQQRIGAVVQASLHKPQTLAQSRPIAVTTGMVVRDAQPLQDVAAGDRTGTPDRGEMSFHAEDFVDASDDDGHSVASHSGHSSAASSAKVSPRDPTSSTRSQSRTTFDDGEKV